MDGKLSPARLADAIRREWRLRHLSDPDYRFLFDPAPGGECVALACVGSSLAADAELLSVCAVRVVGQRVLASERIELLLKPTRPVPADALRAHRLREQDLAQGLDAREAMPRLLRFIGSRPLLGYFLEFDLALIERALKPLIGIGLPNEAIEVSSLYHDWEFARLPPYKQQENAGIDLRFAAMLAALDLPPRDAGDPLDKAVMTALAFIRLRQLGAG